LSARAIGVLREPGAITAWRTPQRTHSSTRVAQAVALASPIVPLTAPTIRAGRPGPGVWARDLDDSCRDRALRRYGGRGVGVWARDLDDSCRDRALRRATGG